MATTLRGTENHHLERNGNELVEKVFNMNVLYDHSDDGSVLGPFDLSVCIGVAWVTF